MGIDLREINMNDMVPAEDIQAGAQPLADEQFNLTLLHPFFTTKELRSSLLANTIEIVKVNCGKSGVTKQALKDASKLSAFALALCLSDQTADQLIREASKDVGVEHLYLRARLDFEAAENP